MRIQHITKTDDTDNRQQEQTAHVTLYGTRARLILVPLENGTFFGLHLILSGHLSH
jgi:hypothetical protein